MTKKRFVFVSLVVIMMLASLFSVAAAKAEKIPQVSFSNVEKGVNVTIVTNFMPENTDIVAYMGELNTKGENGIVVGKMNTGSGGSFSATLPIPDSLKGREYIVVRLEAPKKWFCFNTFQNDPNGTTPIPMPKPSGTASASGKPVYTETMVSGKPYKGFPVFAIKSVEKGKSVTVITDNFPPGLEFTAMIGKLGKNGEDGTPVGKFNSGEGGAFEATFDIPAFYKDYTALAIRLVAPKQYFAYSWFDNSGAAPSSSAVVQVTTTPIGTPEASAGTSTPAQTATPEPTKDPNVFVPKPGGPRIDILSVQGGKAIKVKATNLYPDVEYSFKMGNFGSADTGKEAGKFTADKSGSQELSLEIPEGVKDLNIISILMESKKGFAYNFFYNITTSN
ncbi:MAG: hypothetical protein VB108_10735 [Anaerolineaceae bacterium]|nr:hypothetical protein [Anaerolineaceae bacterium]